MYNEDKNVAAAQKVMLEILVEIHRICVENNITYWLEAGTLLGAIRHKGFIDKQYYYYRKTPTGMCQTSVVKPRTRYDYILACEDRLKYAMRKDMCVPQVRANVIKAVWNKSIRG